MTSNDGACLWWLTTHDPDTGASTRIVGVAGIAGTARWMSYMPHTDAALLWRRLLDATPATAAARELLTDAEGAGSGLATIRIEVAPEAVDLAGQVEAALDVALCDGVAAGRG